MDITYDPAKNARNIAHRGLSFELAKVFEWASAVIVEDTRKDYGERRFQALGLIHGRVYMVVCLHRAATPRT